MLAIDEKPYTEFIHGRPVRKMSSKRRHAVLQSQLSHDLVAQAGTRGVIATEWRFLMPSEPRPTTLVPDVAFVSHERLRTLAPDLQEQPPFAPDLAIEIRSPGDRAGDIAEKIAIYLRNGSQCVLDIDPATRCIHRHEAAGMTTFFQGAVLMSSLVDWLQIDVSGLFARADLPY